jgi:hypothetical protein
MNVVTTNQMQVKTTSNYLGVLACNGPMVHVPAGLGHLSIVHSTCYLQYMEHYLPTYVINNLPRLVGIKGKCSME